MTLFVKVVLLIYFYIGGDYIIPIQEMGIIQSVRMDISYVLRVILMVLLLMKPANITFKVFFSHLKPGKIKSENDRKEQYEIGKLIGSIERLLVGLLLLVNQYAAIGLIFTAKSITRYEKISKDKEFAEYYLLGTLFSMLFTVSVYLLLL